MKNRHGCNECIFYKRKKDSSRTELFCHHKKNLKEMFDPSDGEVWNKVIGFNIENKWNKKGYCRKFKVKEPTS